MGLFKRLIRWALVTKAGGDAGAYPIQQITYLGKTADAVMLFPYGLHANVDGDSIGPVFVFNGTDENRGMLPTSMTRRSKLGSGDVELYSPVSRSRVTIRANGNVEVDGADVSVTASGNATVTAGGDITATASGTLNASAASASITAATIALNGDVTVTGGMSVSGAMTNAGKDVGATHGHVQGVDSNGDSEAPISGVT